MTEVMARRWSGWQRPDGRKGVRNIVLVIYTVQCAAHVAHAIAAGEDDVQVVGFPGCYDNQYAIRLVLSLARHPNVGAVLSVGLGCEYTQPARIAEAVERSGRPADAFFIQDVGGTRSSVERGKDSVRALRDRIRRETPRVEMGFGDLTLGAECGGSDGTSGLVGNPVVGRLFDTSHKIGRNAFLLPQRLHFLMLVQNGHPTQSASPEVLRRIEGNSFDIGTDQPIGFIKMDGRVGLVVVQPHIGGHPDTAL
ncbi:MAG: hypothetical protein EOP59_06615, partial [Sphingomonadales bacterium]